MKMKSLILINVTLIILLLFSCKKNGKEAKPFGAENIEYDTIEGINKIGPIYDGNRPENTPPMAEKTLIEEGPWHLEIDTDINKPPMAESEASIEYDGVPIFEPEHKD